MSSLYVFDLTHINETRKKSGGLAPPLFFGPHMSRSFLNGVAHCAHERRLLSIVERSPTSHVLFLITRLDSYYLDTAGVWHFPEFGKCHAYERA